MDEVSIATKLSSGEAREAIALAYSRTHRLLQFATFCVLVIPGTVVSLLWNGAVTRPTLAAIAQLSLPWIGAVILLRGLLWIRRRRRAAVWYAAADVPPSLKIIARPEGVEVRWDGFQCMQSWHQFERVQDGAAVVVCQNSRLPVIISKRLQTPAELAAIHEWLMTAIPQRIRSKR